MTAAEQARELPKHLVGLPVTVVSQVLQVSMRLQQQVTELAIKGDEVLSSIRPVEETPSWATFDEDLLPVANDAPARNGVRPASLFEESDEDGRDPWEQEERALAVDHAEGEFDSAGDAASPGVAGATEVGTRADTETDNAADSAGAGPIGITNYDTLSLPQLRARLRRFSLAELEELLAYERTHENRPSFVGMLRRRIGNVQRLAEGEPGAGEPVGEA